jgi:hypothetical protein
VFESSLWSLHKTSNQSGYVIAFLLKEANHKQVPYAFRVAWRRCAFVPRLL